MATLAVVKEEVFDEAEFEALRAHYYDPIIEYNVKDPRTSRRGHQRTLKRKVSPPRIDSNSPGFAALKQEITALEGRGDRPGVLGMLIALQAWELRPPSLGGAQPPWARGAAGGECTETIDLTADDAEVVDVDSYIIEVLLIKVVAVKNEPGGARAVEIADPVSFVVVKPEPDAEPAALSQPSPLHGLEEQRPPATEGRCAESASVLEDGPSSRQIHDRSTTADEAATKEMVDQLAFEDTALVEGESASAAERVAAVAEDGENAHLLTPSSPPEVRLLKQALHGGAAALRPSQAQLANDRQALEDDRAAFIRDTDEKLAREEELQQRMRAAAPPPDDLVKLNVGGVRFEASRAVLTKVEDSPLGRMFGRRDAMLQPDPVDGSIFIEGDLEMFGMILDFLRGDPPDGPRMQRAIRALPEAAQDAMMQELDYFGLEAAVFGVRPWTDGVAFRPGPEMREGRSLCAAVFAGGRVVVLGGRTHGRPTRSTEVLDARKPAFAAGPEMRTARQGFGAVQIDTNRVLVAGGKGGAPLNTTEILHLSTLTLTPGPGMLLARCGCACLALDARRILVVGGYNGSFAWAGALAGTEILNLDTMAFSPGPTLATRRYECAAVALDDHRVMVAGGCSTSGPLNTTEILDLRTMSFAPGPLMGSARVGCAAVPVDARHVLVIGGRASSMLALATTELLDVAALEFSPGPSLQAARYGCAAFRLDATGRPRILVIGGSGGEAALPTTTEALFDGERTARPVKSQRRRAPLEQGVGDALAREDAVLPEGEPAPAADDAAADDDGAAADDDGAAADDGEHAHLPAASPPDDVVKLIVGGIRFETSRAVLTKVEDSRLGRMFGPEVGPSIVDRDGGMCGMLGDFLGGDPQNGSTFIDRDGEWFGVILEFLQGDLPDGPRMERTVRALPEAEQAALVQELDYFGLATAVFGVQPWTFAGSLTEHQPSRPSKPLRRPRPAVVRRRTDSATFRPGQGRQKVRGSGSGSSTSPGPGPGPAWARPDPNQDPAMGPQPRPDPDPDPTPGLARVRVGPGPFIDPGPGTEMREGRFGLATTDFGVRPWTDGATFLPGPAMGEGRSMCAAVFAGGRVVVLGGLSGGRCSDSTALLDVQTMTFTAGPDLLQGRYGCAAVKIDANRVLVAGGRGGGQFLSTTEILDLSTLTLTPGPGMLSARSGCAAVALDARRILLVGGHGVRSDLSSTEILSLDTMAFAPGPAMATPRYDCAAVALDEHRVMVVGGSSGSRYLNTTEVLDVRAMAFEPGPLLKKAREGCAAVPVDAGHVLVVGGRGSSATPLATTELLDTATLEFAPGPTMQAGRRCCAAVLLDAGGYWIFVVGGSDGHSSSPATAVLAV